MKKKEFEELKKLVEGIAKKQKLMYKKLKDMSDVLDYVESHTDYLVKADLEEKHKTEGKRKAEYKRILGD